MSRAERGDDVFLVPDTKTGSWRVFSGEFGSFSALFKCFGMKKKIRLFCMGLMAVIFSACFTSPHSGSHRIRTRDLHKEVAPDTLPPIPPPPSERAAAKAG